ncbi:MAG: sensor histidine kinase [Candidatus Latescibacterota bacterium]|jgi:signal transduction histidine kinase|nr:MAG: sensor histidine kinase [Candidatus Latescibacterota bacterium]
MEETLKIRILKAAGNDAAMRDVLVELMERAQAEYCAYCTSRDRELVYILCENRELGVRIPEIREKVRASFRMFTNGFEPESDPLERIMYRKSGPSVAYLLGNPRVESYFLVPLAFGSKVRGVLFLGSVRKEAFGRNDIASLRGLAEEDGERSPLAFRMGGERDLLQRFLAAIPSGAALVSTGGDIVASNAAFADTLGVRDEIPDSVGRIGSLAAFNLQGVWDEHEILQRDVVDREIKRSTAPERHLSVSVVRVDGFTEEAGSLFLVKDVTRAREQAEMREEMIAMVAHELRTPLTALKSSLTILAEDGGCGIGGESAASGDPARRFLANAVRTAERLGMLVDGLIDSSAARIDERPLRIERRDTGAFIEDASSIFVEPMKKKGIDFRVFVDPDTSRLAFDRDRLEQVLQNLLSNSVKHVPSGGAVSITVIPCAGCPSLMLPQALVGRVGPLSFADLCVRDTGGGMPEEAVRRMNRSVETVDRPARASLGLGLRVAQRLIRLHGGSLAVDEGTVGGSAVHLYLPADEATARVVQQYRAAEMRLEEMLSLGLMPEVFCIENAGGEPWENALSSVKGGARIDPRRSEPREGGLLVWPLDASFALGIGPRESGAIALPAGIRAGRSIARRDGMNLRELVRASCEALDACELVPALKGVTE